MGGADRWYADAGRQQSIEVLAQRMDPSFLEAAVREESDPAVAGVAAGGGAAVDSSEAMRVASLLQHMPFAVPFESRLRVLRSWLESDRERHQVDQSMLMQVVEARQEGGVRGDSSMGIGNLK